MRTKPLFAATLFVVFRVSAAHAEQVVVFDAHWTHTADTPDSHYRLPPLAATPANWVSPVDYTKGSAYVHLEVLTKPTNTPTKFQVCFEATPTYGCTAQSDAYTTTGVLDWATPFSGFWSPAGETVDWTQGVHDIAVILKDTMNGKPSAANVGAATAALYTPTEVRVVVTLVSAGSAYVPPKPYDPNPPGSDAGPKTDAGAADGSGTEAAAPPTGAGATDGGGRDRESGAPEAGGTSTGDAATDAKGTGASADAGPASTSTDNDSKNVAGGDESGCSIVRVRAASSSAALGWVVAALLLGATARRRARKDGRRKILC